MAAENMLPNISLVLELKIEMHMSAYGDAQLISMLKIYLPISPLSVGYK